MPLHVLACPRCGAPLPAPATRAAAVTCAYCGAAVTDARCVVSASSYRAALASLELPDDGGPRVEVGGQPYRVHGRVARGESTDVFLAERAHPVTERVVIKVLRASSDVDLLDREWTALTALHHPELQGVGEMSGRFPSPVARGRLVTKGGPERQALVVNARSGYVDTFGDVARAYPDGVDGRHGVWMWRRILEVLAWLHKSGFAHGAVLPQHLVVHAQHHGVMLVGFSCAARLGARAPLPVFCPAARELYPPSLLAGGPPSAATDILMSARCVARILGGTAERVPAEVPAPVASLVEEHARGHGGDDAWTLVKRVGDAAYEAYGRPTFVPFAMPARRL